jgi:hypothetical protein
MRSPFTEIRFRLNVTEDRAGDLRRSYAAAVNSTLTQLSDSGDRL